jgi:hypothetical protein
LLERQGFYNMAQCKEVLMDSTLIYTRRHIDPKQVQVRERRKGWCFQVKRKELVVVVELMWQCALNILSATKREKKEKKDGE